MLRQVRKAQGFVLGSIAYQPLRNTPLPVFYVCGQP